MDCMLYPLPNVINGISQAPNFTIIYHPFLVLIKIQELKVVLINLVRQMAQSVLAVVLRRKMRDFLNIPLEIQQFRDMDVPKSPT